jgi:predicted phage replisome organizer
MAEVQWIKLTTDMFDNRKIRHLRRLPEGNNIVLIWVMLLTMAGRCNSGGMIFLTENIPYTPKMLADELDFEENTVILALQVLEQLDMIVTDNGFFSIAGWDEYQNADKLAEIRAKDRERKRLKRAQAKALLEESKTVHGQSTDSPHIEEEEEKDKEKESHSFIHAEATDEEKEKTKRNLIGGTLGKGVVFISDEQMDSLLDELSIDEFNHYVGIVAECELSGKRFKKKTHYQAIMDMAAKDRRCKKI